MKIKTALVAGEYCIGGCPCGCTCNYGYEEGMFEEGRDYAPGNTVRG